MYVSVPINKRYYVPSNFDLLQNWTVDNVGGHEIQIYLIGPECGHWLPTSDNCIFV